MTKKNKLIHTPEGVRDIYNGECRRKLVDSSDLGGKAGKYRMDQKKIDRINELAKKARTPEGLTPEETQERATLRREYIDTVVGNLARELDNTWVVDENGNKRKLRKRGEENTHD